MGTRKTKKKILTTKKGSTNLYPNSKRLQSQPNLREKDCVETRIRIYELRNPIDTTIIISIDNDLDGGEKKRNKLATKRSRITKGRQRKEEGKKQDDFTVRKNSSLINTYTHTYLLHKGVENRTPDFSRMPTHSSSPHDFASHRKNRNEIRR
jgi:hypothetical protein